MIAYNHVVVIGNLTRDPDVKHVGSAGMKLARLSICINERRKTQAGKLIDNPVFIDVDAWARMAEICEKYLVKNSCIFVEGKLQMAQWEKDGVKHQKLKIRATNIKFIPKGKVSPVKSAGKKYDGEDSQVVEQEVYVPEDATGIASDDAFAEAINNW